MKPYKYLIFLLLVFYTGFVCAQQISVDNTLSAQQLVQTTLGQDCVEISNINSPVNGSSVGISSFGFFERGNSNFPFENGIVIATGNANSAGNTLNNDVLNEGSSDWANDPDLETTLGLTNTVNATTLEFDFTSISNTLQFNYILASEEYFANFPCLYSDGLAFLIREAGTNNPYTNIALIPGTSTPVNSTTIHDEIEGFCSEENDEFFEGYNVGDTNYNGRTSVLTATANIIPNVQYHIKLVIADQTDRNYDSAVFIEANSFNATVDLGEDLTTCANTIPLNADINNSNAQYNWFLDGVILTGQNQPEIDVTQSGTYRVEINIPLGDTFCTIEDEVVINISTTQSTTPMTNFELCDDNSNDGIEVFNLNSKNAEAINSVAPGNYSVTYHTSLPNAQNNTNPITGNYTNAANPQLIYVRIEDIDNGCLAINQFEISVNPLPTITTPQLLQVCDDQVVDGFTTIDLNSVNDEITNGQSNLSVTYHFTQADANSGANAIPLPYVNSGSTDQVFVSVQNPQTGCISTTTLNIEVLAPPILNDTESYYIDACDSDYDGFALFDLTSLENQILNGLTNVTTSYHLNQEEAISGENPIANPTNFTNTIFEQQTIFIRVIDNTTGCPSILPIEIHPNLLLTGPDFTETLLCDNGNDGTEPFNLINITGQILGDIPDVSITFYETEDDRTNGVNEIDTNVNYNPVSTPQTLYLTLTSPTCSEPEEIILDLNPISEFADIPMQTVCDIDQDGLTTIDLSVYDALLYDNQTGFSVTYFETLEDAEDNSNSIGNFYTNTTNPVTVFARISSADTGCADTSSFEIMVNPAPETTTPNPIIICDGNQDGFFTVNLDDVIPDIISATTNRIITFYNNQNDAESASNPILDTATYNAQTETITVRIENTLTNCFTTEALEIIVNTLPIFPNISNFQFCENNTDNIGEFLLNSKDSEILNGQTGKEVLYFLNEQDAISGNNPIDKNSNFENSTNPQQLFVRVQNITDINCFGTDSFTLEVGTNPTFNEPTDIFACDDATNDTFISINLEEKTNQITQGISDNLSVTYYTTIEDLQSGVNAITGNTYTNTSNPQEIYAEIANGSICTSVTSFTVNVIPVPSVTPITPFENCDTDYDGSINWDLTEAEVNILDIRLLNIEVLYFETLEDSESNTNPISNPENYTNTTNPQTVYVRVTNTDFNCPVTLPIVLNVNLPPAVNDFQVYDICANQNNVFDLNTINTLIVDNVANTNITYYTNEQDAIDQNASLNSNYTYQTNTDIIYVRVENASTNCYFIYPFMLNVNELPTVNTLENLEACDDDFDGNLRFDLETQTAAILDQQNSADFAVTYHNTAVEAEANNNAITGTYTAFNGEIIYVRITNIVTGCYNLNQFSIIINPLPLVAIEDQTLCPENFPLVVSAATGFDNDTYAWSNGLNTSEIEITETGQYSVTVTTENGCTATSTFNVIESEPANIEVVETIDFSDPNNITITITGIGDYLFQLDDFEPQESSVFENVSLGYHTVTIIDRNGCSSVTKEVLVIDAPKFFTPNNDGVFDTWHISGVETLPGTVVYIFDRYGKLLKQLNHNSEGWDGTFNGHQLPTSDYWFNADVKQGGIAFTVKGHFTLRR